MAILKNFPVMEVPEWASITENKYVVYWTNDKDGRHKHHIGKLVSGLSKSGKRQFQPNQNFKSEFPCLFNDVYGNYSVGDSHLISGIYAVSLKLSAACGLYQTVQYAFGAKTGNAIMDYAMMCFASKDNTVYQLNNFLASHMHFSVSALSSSSLTTLLTSKITDSMIVNFKNAWMEEYIRNHDVSEVWLSVDGTNVDSKLVGSALAAKGNAKSGKSVDIISQIWAVDASNGMPITWSVIEGNVPDCKAFDNILSQLKASGIKVKGVLLDRGFASEQIMNAITDLGLEYIIMLKGACNGYDEMFSLYADAIRCNVMHLISRDGLYGCTSKARVFQKSSEPTTVGLFFHHLNATERSEHLNTQVFDAITDAKAAIDTHRTPEIDSKFKSIVSIVKGENGQPDSVAVNYAQWQKLFDSKGFFAIASSLELTASEMYPLYASRNASENAFTQVKSMLGFDTLRGHSDASVEARIAVSFIASALRAQFVLACASAKSETNLMLGKLKRVAVVNGINGGFYSQFSGEKQVKSLFNALGITNSDLSDLATQMNQISDRINISEFRTLCSFDKDGILSQSDRHHLSMQGETIEPSCIVAKEFDTIPVKRKPGRPKGSKNKKTLERERHGDTQALKPPAKRGRPLGRKNNKTLEREAAEALLPPKPPAKIGRPKGSKNKKTLEREAALALLPPKPPAKRGRPLGRKNNKTLAREAAQALLATNNVMQAKPSNDAIGIMQSDAHTTVAVQALQPSKPKVGRPKGSLNKSTIAFRERMAKEFEKEHRGRGRPKGSKNRKTLEREAKMINN